MAVAQDTLELEVAQEVRTLVNRAHEATSRILTSMGDRDEIEDFYGVKYTKNLQTHPALDGSCAVVYSGGDEKDHKNNMFIFQKLNSDVLAYIKNGESYCDARKMPDVLRTAIKEYLALK